MLLRSVILRSVIAYMHIYIVTCYPLIHTHVIVYIDGSLTLLSGSPLALLLDVLEEKSCTTVCHGVLPSA